MNHVLVIHSYHKGLTWTDSEEDGIRSVFQKRATDVEVHTEYLDAKTISDDEHYRRFFELLKHKYEAIALKVVIVSDDDAYNFYLKYHETLFPGVPAVFCGVNYFKDSQREGLEDLVTGVVEAFDITHTLRTALRLHPHASQVVVINDRTTTGLENKRMITEKIEPEFNKKATFVYLEDLTMAELLEKVRSLAPGDIILLMTFNRDRSGKVFSYDQSIAKIANEAKVPIYGVWDFYLGKGIVGGMLTSGVDQGRIAGEMALRVMDGEKVRTIPVVRDSPNRYEFDFQQMQRFGIKISELPSGSRVVNEPVSFYALHKGFVWMTSSGFLAMTTIIVLLLANIRQRKQGVEALRESEIRYRTLVNNVNVGVYRNTGGPRGRFIQANPAMARIFGYDSVEEFLEIPAADLYQVSENRIHFLEEIQRNGLVKEKVLAMKKKDGALIWCSVTATAQYDENGNIAWMDGVLEDISERKSSEEALQTVHNQLEQKVGERTKALSEANLKLEERERQLRQIIDLVPHMIFVKDWDGKYLLVNQAVAESCDTSVSALTGKYCSDLHPDESQQQLILEEDREVMRKGEPKFIPEEAYTDALGNLHFLQTTKVPFHTIDNNTNAVLVISIEITERKQAEEKLLIRNLLLSTQQEASIDGILVVDEENRILSYNRRFVEMWGIPERFVEQGADEPVLQLVTAQMADPQSFLQRVQYLYEHKHENSRDELLLADGRFFDRYSAPMLGSDGRYYGRIWYFRDLTDEKRLQEEKIAMERRLQRGQKAESLARMAGAIAHNFNNMLGAVIGNLELALDDAPSGTDLEVCIKEAMKSSQQAAEISRFMLAYLGQTVGREEPLDPVGAMSEICVILGPSIPANVRLRSDLPSLGVLIEADRRHLTQIATNLVTNAVEAIGGHEGEISITATVVPGTEVGRSNIHPFGWEPKAGEYLCLSVGDTGCGIVPENLDRIFDPFFTTKFFGRGLGLSAASGLLQTTGGAISVESHPGKGATFRVFLPVLEHPKASDKQADPLLANHVAEGWMVLVVDDEPALRMMAQSMLSRKLGCRVVSACDGAQAVELFRARRDEIALVLLDLSMPGMSGWETLEALRTIRSDIPVILASGYDEAQVMQGGGMERPQAFLHKPYGAKELRAVVIQAQKAGRMEDEHAE